MTNLQNKEVFVTVGNKEYKGIVTDFNNTYAWVSIVMEGEADEYCVKLEAITLAVSQDEALAIIGRHIADEADSFKSDLDILSEKFSEYVVDGHDETIILKGYNYDLYVEVTEYDGKTVYNMETVNLNRLAVKKANRKIGEFDADFVDSATGNEITRKTMKGIIALIEKWLVK